MGDALALSLDEIGMLDLNHIAGLMKMSRTEAIEALGDMIYETPSGEHLLADEYLLPHIIRRYWICKTNSLMIATRASGLIRSSTVASMVCR
jgi:N12 class adenine-specific DNA methylase